MRIEQFLCYDSHFSGHPILHMHVYIKGKIFYGPEPSIGESTTTECGVNYQLLAVSY